ncbi:MAG: radical SAM protein [Candidatus Krumholzibacteriota bacterium]|nr:radical SAM protein [Candidatus Krumholzibacteriota bacterium]
MDTCLASWYISERCNFRCSYCYIYNPPGMKGVLRRAKAVLRPRPPKRPDIHEHLDEILDRFLATGMRFTFAFTGGEPFVYPRFVEICRRIAERDEFTIGLDTNLSMGVDQLMEAVPPEKTAFVFASTHALERLRLFGTIDPFLDDVARLIGRGYSVETNYVMHPDLFGRFETDRRRALERGVILTPKAFKGVYGGAGIPTRTPTKSGASSAN